MNLTRAQIEQKIEELEAQGASQDKIQNWLDSLSTPAPATPAVPVTTTTTTTTVGATPAKKKTVRVKKVTPATPVAGGTVPPPLPAGVPLALPAINPALPTLATSVAPGTTATTAAPAAARATAPTPTTRNWLVKNWLPTLAIVVPLLIATLLLWLGLGGKVLEFASSAKSRFNNWHSSAEVPSAPSNIPLIKNENAGNDTAPAMPSAQSTATPSGVSGVIGNVANGNNRKVIFHSTVNYNGAGGSTSSTSVSIDGPPPDTDREELILRDPISPQPGMGWIPIEKWAEPGDTRFRPPVGWQCFPEIFEESETKVWAHTGTKWQKIEPLKKGQDPMHLEKVTKFHIQVTQRTRIIFHVAPIGHK